MPNKNVSSEDNHTDTTTSKINFNGLSPLDNDDSVTETTEFIPLSENVSDLYENNIDHFGTEINSSDSNTSDSFTSRKAVKSTVHTTHRVDEATSIKNILILSKYETEVRNNLGYKKTKDGQSIRHNLVNDNVEMVIPVGIQYDQVAKAWMEEAVTSSTTTLNEKNHIPEENNKVPSSDFINNISVSATITVALILLVIVIVAVKRKYKSKQKLNKKNVNVSTMAVYTTSIFHTPLPGNK